MAICADCVNIPPLSNEYLEVLNHVHPEQNTLHFVQFAEPHFELPLLTPEPQLEKNYGKEGAEIIIDNCQDMIFGGFAPNSESAQTISKNLGNKTVMSGSINRGKNDPSQSLQMIERPLMTPDELKTLPKGTFIVSKTGSYPMKTRLKLFLKWGIKFEESYTIEEKSARKVAYADKNELEQEILLSTGMYAEQDFEESNVSGGMLQDQNLKNVADTMTKMKSKEKAGGVKNMKINKAEEQPRKRILRTDE